jgi:hypothetical protein
MVFPLRDYYSFDCCCCSFERNSCCSLRMIVFPLSIVVVHLNRTIVVPFTIVVHL